MSQNTPPLDTWAVVELFGHQKIAGKLSEVNIGANVMIKVMVPKTDYHPEYDRLFNPSAIYAINPMEESLVVRYAETLKVAPITPYEASAMFEKIIEEKVQRRLQPTNPESNDFPDEENEDF